MAKLGRILAVMGAGLGGYNDGKKELAREEEIKAEKTYRDELRQRDRTTYQRDEKTRADVAAAGAPVGMVDAPQADLSDPEAAPMQQYKVQDRMYTDQAGAGAAVAEANAPAAVAQRQAQAYMANGDPARAQQIRAGAQSEQLGAIQLGEAQRKVLNQKFDDTLNSQVTSFDDLANVISASKGDGQGGALKVATVISADGKKVSLVKLGPNGEKIDTGQSFDNNTAGLLRAKSALSRSVSPEAKLTHLHQQAQEEQAKAQLAEATRHNTATESLTGREQDRRAANDNARLGIDRQRLSLERERSKAQPAGMTFGDLKDGHKSIAATLNADYKAQIEAPGADAATLDSIKRTRESETADVQRLYTGAMTQGIPVTPEQAIAAFRTGKRGFADVPDGTGKTVRMEVINANGRLIPMAPAPGSPAPVAAAKSSAKSGSSEPPPVISGTDIKRKQLAAQQDDAAKAAIRKMLPHPLVQIGPEGPFMRPNYGRM